MKEYEWDKGYPRKILPPPCFQQPIQEDSLPIAGVGPDAPTVENTNGAKQSQSPYEARLLPMRALLEIAKVLKSGAEKYGEENWRGLSVSEHLNHDLVHVMAHLAGDRSEGDVGHLVRHACRALMALEMALK